MPDLNTVLWQSANAGLTDPLLGYWQFDSQNITPQISPSRHSASNLEFVGTGNFDGDATEDVLWQQSVDGGYEIVIWFMNADNTLRASETVVLNGETTVAVQPNGIQIQRIADFDGDGNDDIFFRYENTNRFELWKMDGLTGTKKEYAGSNLGLGQSLNEIFAIGDFDGNGTQDFLFYNATSNEVSTWLLDQNLNLIEPSGAQPNGPGESGPLRLNGAVYDPIYNLSEDWVVLGVTDVNRTGNASDNRDDIILKHHSNGQVVVWLMDGALIQDWDFLGGQSDPAAKDLNFVGVGDFNGDGNGDLLWRSTAPNQPTLAVWLLEGRTLLPETGFVQLQGESAPYSLPENWEIVSFQNMGDSPKLIDFDLNDRADIYLKNRVSGQTVLWSMDGRMINTWDFGRAPNNSIAVVPSGYQPIGRLSVTMQRVDALKIYVAPGIGGDQNPTDLADWFEDVALRIDLNGDGNLASRETVRFGRFDDANNTIDHPNITYADTGVDYTFGSTTADIWEVNFGNLGLILPSFSTYSFGVKGSGRYIDGSFDAYYPWFMVAANAALSNYGPNAFTDDRYRQFNPIGNFAAAVDSNGNGWNKSSDILVQVFDDQGVLLTDRGLPDIITSGNLVRWVADPLFDPALSDFLGDDFQVRGAMITR